MLGTLLLEHAWQLTSGVCSPLRVGSPTLGVLEGVPYATYDAASYGTVPLLSAPSLIAGRLVLVEKSVIHAFTEFGGKSAKHFFMARPFLSSGH